MGGIIQEMRMMKKPFGVPRNSLELTKDSLKMGEAFVDIGKSYNYMEMYDSSMFLYQKESGLSL